MTDTAYRRILLVRIFPKPCSRYPKTVRLANHDLPDKPDLSISSSRYFGQAATRYHARRFLGGGGYGEEEMGKVRNIPTARFWGPTSFRDNWNKTLAATNTSARTPTTAHLPRPPTCRHKEQP